MVAQGLSLRWPLHDMRRVPTFSLMRLTRRLDRMPIASKVGSDDSLLYQRWIAMRGTLIEASQVAGNRELAVRVEARSSNIWYSVPICGGLCDSIGDFAAWRSHVA